MFKSGNRPGDRRGADWCPRGGLGEGRPSMVTLRIGQDRPTLALAL